LEWRRHATIVVNYKPPHAAPEDPGKCVVLFDCHRDGKPYRVFLRHSKGPRQGHDWDSYGDDYQTPELALMALLQAPVPAIMLVR